MNWITDIIRHHNESGKDLLTEEGKIAKGKYKLPKTYKEAFHFVKQELLWLRK